MAPFQIFLLLSHCFNFRQEPVGDGYVLDVSINAHMNRWALHKTEHITINEVLYKVETVQILFQFVHVAVSKS